MRQQLRRPALRASPANHTALVSLPRLDDVVIPPPPPTRLIPTASKQSSGGDDSQQQLVAAAASGTDDKLDDDEEERKQPSDDASWIMPTDTKIALEMMCAQFPKIEKASVRPFVLRTQLYSSVRDRTLVDRELEVLRQQQVEPSSSADSLVGCLSAFFVTVSCAVCLIRVSFQSGFVS